MRISGSLLLISAALIFVQAEVFAQSSTPTLELITPAEKQQVYGNQIPVLLSVENFEIVDYQANPSPAPGKGHIHLWLDDANPTPQSAVKVVDDNYTFRDVAFGEHTLRAELVSNDHKSLKLPQVVTLNFKNAAISDPDPITQSGFDKNTALVILVVVALVIVAAWWYTKEEDEEELEKITKKTTLAKSKKKTTKKTTKRKKK